MGKSDGIRFKLFDFKYFSANKLLKGKNYQVLNINDDGNSKNTKTRTT